MIPTRSLTNKVTNLERQRNQHGAFQIVEENHPEGQFNGACDYVLRRNGVPVFRWPKKPASIEEWEACFTVTNPGINP